MFAQRPRSFRRDGGSGGFADGNMPERREYEVPIREREREEGFRRQPRKAADPWGRPQRVLQRRNTQRAMQRPPPQHQEPLPQREPPPPMRRELPPPQMLREPQPERYFCPNCTCPSCRPEDPGYLPRGAPTGGMFVDGRGGNQSRSLPSPEHLQVMDDRMRQRYDALPPANEIYFQRERAPMKGEEPMRRGTSWPRQEQRPDGSFARGPNWGGGIGGGRSGGADRRPFDWDCPSCNAHNYADKTACYVCSLPKPEEGSFGGAGKKSVGFNGESRGGRKRNRDNYRPGDWDCPQCSAHNFASKTACFKCNIPKPDEIEPNSHQSSGGGSGGGRRRGRREVERRPGDWTCRDCNANNFKRNVKCFKCDSPKEA